MALLTDDIAVARRTGNGFFIWSVVLLLMTGLCFASWVGSFYVVAHPEEPKCYAILKKFKRVEPPKRFAVTEAPKGEFLSAAKLLDHYGKLGKVELAFENAVLLRNYLTNFRESGKRVPYVAGKFQVVQSFALGKSDCFPSGAVAVAQSENLPQMLVEFVFPAAPDEVAAIRETVTMGADITLQRSQDLWALLHVERHADGRMQFTVMPLPYGGWQRKRGQGSFVVQSPEELARDYHAELNLKAGLPIVRDPRLAAAQAGYKEFRRRQLARGGDDMAALAGPELVRFELVAGAAPKVEPASADPQAAALPGRQRARMAHPQPTPAPAMPLANQPAVKPRPGSGIIGAEPGPTPVPARDAKIPEPMNAAVPVKSRRALSAAEASALVDHFPRDERVVLSGDFVVTGVLGTRVALRTRESLRDPDADPSRPGSSAALIVVEYPSGVTVPEKDATFTRDAARGFLIRDVIRGRDGQITVVVNEGAGD